jgi:hypothetical protein
MTTFLVHDNRGRPFQVTVGDDNVQISVHKYKDDVYKPWKQFSFQQAFIGQGEYDSEEASPFNYGNAALFRVDELEYLFVGWKIVTFKALAPMV